jgi:hypothetical protein
MNHGCVFDSKLAFQSQSLYEVALVALPLGMYFGLAFQAH